VGLEALVSDYRRSHHFQYCAFHQFIVSPDDIMLFCVDTYNRALQNTFCDPHCPRSSLPDLPKYPSSLLASEQLRALLAIAENGALFMPRFFVLYPISRISCCCFLPLHSSSPIHLAFMRSSAVIVHCCQDRGFIPNAMPLLDLSFNMGISIVMLTSHLCRGCVTAKQLANIRKFLTDGGEGPINWDICDGFHELKPEDQAKVREALEKGYVPDEDWKGVSIYLEHHSFCISLMVPQDKDGNRPEPPKAPRKKKAAEKAEKPKKEDKEPMSVPVPYLQFRLYTDG
jgi:hypothetical protein